MLELHDYSDDGSIVTVVLKTPVTYNRKDPAEIPIQNSLPNVGGSSDSSSVTVVSPEDRVKEKQDRPKDKQDDNTYINGSVKKMIDYPDLEVMNIVKNIKAAKETENTVQGLVSNKTDFRSTNEETFLFDTGATVLIIQLQVAKNNSLKISRL